MIYTTPPQTDNMMYMSPGQHRIVQSITDVDDGDDNADDQGDQMEQTAENTFPGSVMLGEFKDGGGRVFKMHIRDGEGHVKTIRFDHNQNISETDDGEC